VADDSVEEEGEPADMTEEQKKAYDARLMVCDRR
jgi:hypothetical protein